MSYQQKKRAQSIYLQFTTLSLRIRKICSIIKRIGNLPIDSRETIIHLPSLEKSPFSFDVLLANIIPWPLDLEAILSDQMH